MAPIQLRLSPSGREAARAAAMRDNDANLFVKPTGKTVMFDVETVAWSLMPAVAYFCALPLYVALAPRAQPSKWSMEIQSHMAIASTPLPNLALAAWLFDDVRSLRVSHILLAILVIDTAEYWSHRLLHTPYLFNTLHHVHHSIGVPHPSCSFVNHFLEILFTTPPIVLGMLVGGCSFREYVVATALAFVATLADHVSTHPRSFHVLHHCGNKRCNLQQPFFTFWDRLCGTYDPRSKWKIPFFP